MRIDALGGLAVLVLVAAATACLEPTDPNTVAVERLIARIGQNRTLDTVQVRRTIRVHAAAYAREGYDLGLTEFDYESSDPRVAMVDSIGVITGVAPGTAVITVSIPQGHEASVTVVVVPSTIAYRLEAARTPGQIAFSTDYTRAYVLTKPDSLLIVDALGMFRLASIALPMTAHDVASTASHVLITHPDDDSVTIVSKALNSIEARIWVGAGPTGIVAAGNRAYVAARFDRKVIIVDDGTLTLAIPMDGEPHELALSTAPRRLFATVERESGWWVVAADPAAPDTIGSFALPARPTALAASRDGSRVFVLIGDDARLLIYDETFSGRYELSGSVDVGAGAAGVSVSHSVRGYVVVSGEPVTILDGHTLEVLERVNGAGAGAVQVRPDGIFVFIASPAAGVVNVVEL